MQTSFHLHLKYPFKIQNPKSKIPNQSHNPFWRFGLKTIQSNSFLRKTEQRLMGFSLSKSEKWRRLLRALKTLIFLVTMLGSLVIVSAPILLIITDALVPSVLLSLASSSPSLDTLFSLLKSYDFQHSLIDIPLISIIRSAVILCSYWFCNGPRLSRGPYLVTTTLCCVASMVFVSVKAPYVFGGSNSGGCVRPLDFGLFMSSMILAVGHIVIAYRISCRERRKLLIYKIDIEALAAHHKGFPTYNKILQEVRVK